MYQRTYISALYITHSLSIFALPSLNSFDIILSMESTTTTKLKIVLAKKPDSTEFNVYDYDSLEVLSAIDLSKLTLPQCVNMLKDHYEIAGFLSYWMIIPLVGLIPGHESKRIENVHERLDRVAAWKKKKEIDIDG